ncbi:MAG: glycosyltransferase family protein [Bacteroidota bacterium]
MRFIFIVQGEGRGHMTQGISLSQMLNAHGHEVCHVIVGKSRRRELPAFFAEQIRCPLTQVSSPNFVADRKSKSVSLFKTLFFNMLRLPVYLKSIDKIDQIIKEEQPDRIINFYDFIAGFYFLMKRSSVSHVAIAHQFLLNHSEFEFPKGKFFDRFALKLGNRLAGFKAEKLLCLSFQFYEDEKEKRIFVVPPLLRKELELQRVEREDFFLIYMVNHGYAEQVREFHRAHPELQLHCFWDKRGVPDQLVEDETLTFHRLNDTKFLSLMARCKGYLSTAGFESICEAMYLGKPVLMVPVQGHYEQLCNAVDAVRSGAGISSSTFDLQLLLDYLPRFNDVSKDFKSWCKSTDDTFLKNLIDK